jgi:hypothetical protein
MARNQQRIPELTVYSRPGCHLCELFIEQLLPLTRAHGNVQVHDIDTREDWTQEYGTRIPVLEIDGRFVCQYYLDRDAVQRAIDTGIAAISTS